mmetsp:Transcript_16275/g.41838  ORF Transcript_16275/g.41838 Transcript_16275/m.41838 type:complete len:134 (-) Transcript_16275:42-443(-)
MPTKPKETSHRGVRQQWTRGADNKKKGNKNHNPRYPLTETALESRIQRDQARLDAVRAAKAGVEEVQEVDPPERDEAENRVLVKFLWKRCGSPTEEAEWHGRNGAISLIRRWMGKSAPAPRTVERVLQSGHCL